jgi:inner membrane protein
MMALTHAAIATCGVSLVWGDASPLVLGLAVIGSQLPDVDTSTSIIGQILFPISSYLEDRYPHRSLTHSFIATLALALVGFPLYHYWGLKPWLALGMGHLLSCFSDTFTKQGVQLFFPSPVWCVCGSNPNRRIRTGSTAEYWILAAAITILTINIQIVHTGGIIESASQNLGLRYGATTSYNRNATSHEVYAVINGVYASDSSPAKGEFLIISVDKDDFYVIDQNQEVYKTGQEIILSSLKTQQGNPATTQVFNLTFNDEGAIAKLNQLSQAPNALIFLTGSLTLDFPDELKIETHPKSLEVAELSGSTLKLNHCPLSKAIALLKDQYAIGTVTVKVITPQAEG